MPIAITDDHKALADAVSQLLTRRESKAAARALLEAPTEEAPTFWSDLVGLGLPGLHVPEEYGGAGGDLTDLVVAVEELGAALSPGAFVPSAVVSAVLVASDDDAAKKTFLPGLADGSRTAAVALEADVQIQGGAVTGTVAVALGGGLADLLALPVGDDVAVLELRQDGVEVTVPPNLDPSRRAARVTLAAAPATVLTGTGAALRDLGRLILAAEAVGVARASTTMAAEYAKVREQFGRPIAMFQAVKHHCANMLVATELATSAVWDGARAATGTDTDQRALTAAVAATLAGAAAYDCANLNIQVHGGIGMTWEHDTHLFLRRATALRALLDPDAAAADATDLHRRGVRRTKSVDLPPEAESIRDEVREFVARIKDADADAQRDAMIETGYVMPHWP